MLKKLICIIALVSLVFAMFTGCEPKKEERPVAVCIIIGNHGNSKELDVNNGIVQDVVSKAVSTYGYVSVICVDADPDIVAKGSLDINERYKNADPDKLAADATTKTLTILNGLRDVVADDPEVDTLAAMTLGAKSFAEAPSNAIKIMVVMDTGLCTTGLCDYHNNLMNADPVAVANALEEKKAIPKLDGVEVKWLYMGNVSYPQEKLSERQIAQLNAMWEAIVVKGGGTFDSDDIPCTEEYTDKVFPAVSPIQLEKEQPVKFDSGMLEGDANPFAEPTFLREEQVRFVADSDTLVDPEGTNQVIAPIADYMKSNQEFRLLLVGTTAGDGASDFAVNLSNARANRIKQLLVEKGISEDRIVTLGMGGNDPWHIYNVGTSGELAAQNRKVVLLDAQSQIAQELLG